MAGLPSLPPPPVPPFRLCLDLNVWCSAAIARTRGHSGTASLALTEAVRRGWCALGSTQLVVSWGMVTRLESVLTQKLRWDRRRAERVLGDIVSIARLGPAATPPLVLLGGTGVVPIREEEDAHVLEVAVTGRAHVLATLDFSDFVNYRTEVLKPNRIAKYRTADHEVIIAHPAEAAAWVRTGEIVLG